MTRTLTSRAVRAGAWTLSMPCATLAAETAAAPVGAGDVLQVLLGLAAVVAMVLVAAWAMRRFNPNIASGGSALRVVGGTAVGNRERVLLLEVDDTWLVVGVAPGRVSRIHSMPRPHDVRDGQAPAAPKSGFAAWLNQALERRKHG